jgi:Gpi18-like mannosyltransferase
MSGSNRSRLITHLKSYFTALKSSILHTAACGAVCPPPPRIVLCKVAPCFIVCLAGCIACILTFIPPIHNAILLNILAAIQYNPKAPVDLLDKALWASGMLGFVFFDFMCATLSLKILNRIIGMKKRNLLVFCAVLFSPVVIMNGMLMPQWDGIYTGFLLCTLLCFLKNKPKSALACFGIAFSFKLQSVYALPFVIILFLYKKWKFKYLLVSIFSFLAMFVPGWILGMRPYEWIIIFGKQLVDFSGLAINAPTIYAWFADTELTNKLLSSMGIIFTLTILFSLAAFVFLAKRDISQKTMLTLFLFSTLVVPFFLPHTHERYFYPAEIAALLYAFILPKRWWIALLIILPACFTYSNFLFGGSPFPLKHLVFPMIISIFCITKWLITAIMNDPPCPPTECLISSKPIPPTGVVCDR